MRTVRAWLVVALLAAAGGGSAAAATEARGPGDAAASAAASAAAPRVSEFARIRESADRALEATPGAVTLPPELAAQDQQSHAEFLKWQRQFARDSWEWHLFSTKLLMHVVLLIVACGLWFTYLQFTKDLKARPPAPLPASAAVAAAAAPTPAGDAIPAPVRGTTMKFGLGGVEITSQVIGLLVLAFSLAFFYLYIKEVYPMQEAHLQQQADNANAPAAAPAAK